MYFFDLGLVLKFWFILFLLGIIFLPITNRLFSIFVDKGYIFSKIIALISFSYLLFLLGTLKLLPFSIISFILILIIYLAVYFFITGFKLPRLPQKKLRRIWVFEESLFLGALLFWSYIKGFQPDINGLEKFMDFGFINSILRSDFFPALDMWFTPESINYYYFGHVQTAFLTKITGIEPYIFYNIMLTFIFAFCFVGSFSLIFSVSYTLFKKINLSFFAGILSALIVTVGGNLHTVYAFFESYNGELPVPFWTLKFLPLESFGMGYWYPNATRFIQNTIHEFPSYSFVVSDLHGHVLDIPNVLLVLALAFVLIQKKEIKKIDIVLFSFLTGIMYMTNAWDGIIYSGLMALIIFIKNISIILKVKLRKINDKKNTLPIKKFLTKTFINIAILGIGVFLFTLPFNAYFKPFASGIGVLCAPEFLEGKTLGPLLFEKDHCQRSPLYQLLTLWGFFYIIISLFIIYLIRKGNKIISTPPVIFSLLLFFFSSILILVPEFIYAKDIYPAHYRANTMFKLGYQAFIMFSLVSGFAIVVLLKYWNKFILIPVFSILLGLILIYPYFSVKAYFGDITPDRYQGLNGISYLKFRYPNDYEAIIWIQDNVKGQPVIAEAQGDSYTDYARVSSNTGLPTILGWTVHEWLWRGEYSIPEPRIDEVRSLYEDDIPKTQEIINKYNVEYIFVGNLEREKYKNLNEEKFSQLGTQVFREGNTAVYKVN